MNTYSNTINISGAKYAYDNTVTLVSGSLPYNSGVAAYNFRPNTADDTAQSASARYLTKEERDDISLFGALGEVAFAVKFNQPFDIEHGKGPDFVISGQAVEVKTSDQYPNLFLPKRHWDNEPTATYVAIQQKGDSYVFEGWIKGKDIPKVAIPTKEKCGKPAFLILKKHLKPFSAFIGEKLD